MPFFKKRTGIQITYTNTNKKNNFIKIKKENIIGRMLNVNGCGLKLFESTK